MPRLPGRKKIRTQGRIAREKEKQEQIKLGLLEPPKPRVKYGRARWVPVLFDA